MRIFFIVLSFVFLAASIAAKAAAPKAVSTFKKWEVYTTKQDGKKFCYIASYPIKESGNYKHRGDRHFLVTHMKGSSTYEVSVDAGYPYKDKSVVKLEMDGKHKHKLFTSNKTPKVAWATDSDEDKKIIAEMKKGIKLTAKGTSKLSTYSIDTYSLAGFTKAYGKMVTLCKK